MSEHLNGKILIGIPKDDKWYDRVPIILISGQDKNGTVGFVVNQPMLGLDSNKFLKEFKIPPSNNHIQLHYGGPTETSRGFVLHTIDYSSSATIFLGSDIGLTTTVDVLKKISNSKGPSKYIILMGYVIWDIGELDQEIQDNLWIVSDMNMNILFDTPLNDKWKKFLLKIGVSNPFFLSSYGGRA